MTLQALRRDPGAAERFPDDVRELQGYLSGRPLLRAIEAYPGTGTHVPLYILGSSLFGARLAAAFGLPYAFASHFAPDLLEQAVATYRDGFRPSEQCDQPYVIAAVNVIAADDREQAQQMAGRVLRSRVRSLAGRATTRGAVLDDAAIDELTAGPLGAQARHMMTYTAIGDGTAVCAYLARFAELAHADEVMVTNVAPGLSARERALEILADLT